jgi:polyisoprenoid-binding protein YceI
VRIHLWSMKMNRYHVSQTRIRSELQQLQSGSIAVKKEAPALWAIDQTHSEIGFRIRHLMISNIRGVFTDFAVRILTPGNDFEASEIAVWIDAGSISTSDAKRDEHLKSNSFFDTDNFKSISFTGSKLKRTREADKFILEGDLTIKNITRGIKLNVEFGGIKEVPFGHIKAGFFISGTIRRQDWGLTWNASLDSGGMLIGDEVHIACDIQLIRPSHSVIPKP